MDKDYEQTLSFFAGLGAIAALHSHLDYLTDTLICQLLEVSGVNRYFITGNMTSIQREDLLKATLADDFMMHETLRPEVKAIQEEYGRIRQKRNTYLHALWYPDFKKQVHRYYQFSSRRKLKLDSNDTDLIQIYTLVEAIQDLTARIKKLFDDSEHLPDWQDSHTEPGVAVMRTERLREHFRRMQSGSPSPDQSKQ